MMLNKSENLPRKDFNKNISQEVQRKSTESPPEVRLKPTGSPPEADQKPTGSPPEVHRNPTGSPPELASWTLFCLIFELRILNWFENLRNFGIGHKLYVIKWRYVIERNYVMDHLKILRYFSLLKGPFISILGRRFPKWTVNVKLRKSEQLRNSQRTIVGHFYIANETKSRPENSNSDPKSLSDPTMT